MLTRVQVGILKTIAPDRSATNSRHGYEGRSKLVTIMGEQVYSHIAGKSVIDFGCGGGDDSIEMALCGARRVQGVDIREELLEIARKKAIDAGVQDKCAFATSAQEPAEVSVSLDAFEHFADPAGVLDLMSKLLPGRGEVLMSFGPTWYHPSGGHLFSVFPWAHLIFSEKALVTWRSTFKSDGATRFSEVAGGLNQMTIARFEELVAQSPFTFASLELVPISKLRYIQTRFTREFTTAVVRCRLLKRIS